MANGDLAGWIARLDHIPSDLRTFEYEIAGGCERFGLPAELWPDLIEAGLPVCRQGDRVLVDRVDLHYLSLRLGAPSPELKAMRRWAAALAATNEDGARCATVKYFASGPAGADVSVEVAVPGGERLTGRLRGHQVLYECDLWLDGRWPAAPPALADLLHDVASGDFCVLPAELRDDLCFARTTGLVDCGLAANLVIDGCTRLGFSARHAFGVLVTSPLSSTHHWAEVRLDGRWVPFDPLLLSALARFAGLDAHAWNPGRSIGPVVARIGPTTTPLVTANGDWLTVSLPTTFVDA